MYHGALSDKALKRKFDVFFTQFPRRRTAKGGLQQRPGVPFYDLYSIAQVTSSNPSVMVGELMNAWPGAPPPIAPPPPPPPPAPAPAAAPAATPPLPPSTWYDKDFRFNFAPPDTPRVPPPDTRFKDLEVKTERRVPYMGPPTNTGQLENFVQGQHQLRSMRPTPTSEAYRNPDMLPGEKRYKPEDQEYY